MKVITRHSRNTDIEAAMNELCAGIETAEGIVVLAPTLWLKPISEKLNDKYPNVPTIGAGGTHVYHEECCTDGITLVFFIEGVKIVPGLITKLSSAPAASIMEIANNVGNIQPGDNDTICFEFSTNSHETLVSTFNTAFKLSSIYGNASGIKLVGGAIYNMEDTGNNCVYYNGKIYKDSCVYFMIKNLGGKIRTYMEQIYEIDGDEIYTATKVNFSTHELKEINNKPAAEIYAKHTGLEKVEIRPEYVCGHPMGRIIGDKIYAFSQDNVTPDGSLVNHSLVNEGDKICFMKSGDYKKTNKETIENILRETPHPSLVFVFDCAYRILFYDQEGYLNEYLKNASSAIGEYIGYTCGGEQFEEHHMNQGCVYAVFE